MLYGVTCCARNLAASFLLCIISPSVSGKSSVFSSSTGLGGSSSANSFSRSDCSRNLFTNSFVGSGLMDGWFRGKLNDSAVLFLDTMEFHAWSSFLVFSKPTCLFNCNITTTNLNLAILLNRFVVSL